MNSVERIKNVCREKKIPFHRLEMACGFANGYIAKLKDGKIPADRLYKIANYLDVSPEYLLNGTEKSYYSDETVEMAQAIFDNPELKLLYNVAKDSSPEDINTIYQVLLALKRKERQ